MHNHGKSCHVLDNFATLKASIAEKVDCNFNHFLTHSVPVLPSYETSQLKCCANRFTCFYMRATLALNGLSKPQQNISEFSKYLLFLVIEKK